MRMRDMIQNHRKGMRPGGVTGTV